MLKGLWEWSKDIFRPIPVVHLPSKFGTCPDEDDDRSYIDCDPVDDDDGMRFNEVLGTQQYLDRDGEVQLKRYSLHDDLHDANDYHHCIDCDLFIPKYGRMVRDHMYEHYRAKWEYPRTEYYLDKYGVKHEWYVSGNPHISGINTLLNSEIFNYDESIGIFVPQLGPAGLFYRERLMTEGRMANNAGKPKNEDMCDLRCPRDCECWSDRHPKVMAAYESPVGVKGSVGGEDDVNYHLLTAADCECIACATEILTPEETEMQELSERTTIAEFTPGAKKDLPHVQTTLVNLSKDVNIQEIMSEHYQEGEREDVPENATFWVEIRRVNPDEFFKVKACNGFRQFVMVDDTTAEFRPSCHFSQSGDSMHVVETTGDFKATLTVNRYGDVKSIHVEGKEVDHIALPKNHTFFRHVQITIPFRDL